MKNITTTTTALAVCMSLTVPAAANDLVNVGLGVALGAIAHAARNAKPMNLQPQAHRAADNRKVVIVPKNGPPKKVATTKPKAVPAKAPVPVQGQGVAPTLGVATIGHPPADDSKGIPPHIRAAMGAIAAPQAPKVAEQAQAKPEIVMPAEQITKAMQDATPSPVDTHSGVALAPAPTTLPKPENAPTAVSEASSPVPVEAPKAAPQIEADL